MKMTRRNINLFSLFVCGCIVLLFVRKVHSYPHTEFRNLSSFESFESDEDEFDEFHIHTTRAPFRKNHPPVSNTNHAKKNGSNLGSSKSAVTTTTTTTTHKPEIQIEPRHGQMQGDDSQIVFPTEGTPPRCNNSGFCENVPNYPEEMINNAIRRNSSLKYLETMDEPIDIQSKINPSDADERPLCESTSQIIYPQMAQSKNKGGLIVVNQENFKQGVRIEKCLNVNGECSIAGNNIPGGYRTKCVQKYIDRKLVAVTDLNEISQELFPIPSSCCCHAVFVNGAERFGMGIKQTSQVTPAKNPRQ